MHRDKQAIIDRLEDVRTRTLTLLEPVADEDFRRQSPAIVSPVVSELARIASFEEIWCLRRLGAATAFSGASDRMLDALATPSRLTEGQELPSRDACFSSLARVRAAVLAQLERVDLASTDPLVRNGTVWELAAQHEEQVQETILASLALLEPGRYVPIRRSPLALPACSRPQAVLIPAGKSFIGAAGFGEDDEHPAHMVPVPTFEIDSVPATQGDFLAFVDDQGYHRRDLWSPEGWQWLERAAVDLPLGWERDSGGRMHVHNFEKMEPLALEIPMSRVSWFEADAFARWKGKRLPTEAEWEKAASWDPAFGCQRRMPWGIAPWTTERADLDQLGFGPGPVACRPEGASPYGVLDMVGGVWEWTASDFSAYPGFAPFPCEEASKIQMGRGLKVLRGGSWATRPAVARASFRNRDVPSRRHLFAGVRLARSA